MGNHVKKHSLVNVSEPNLFREMFPYHDIPKLVFESVSVPVNVPDNIWITDTTFRDGQQSRPPYTVEQIVDIFGLLHRLSGPKGIIRQTEFFLYSTKDKEAVKQCQAKGYEFPEITGWIRAVKSDFQLVKEMGLKETGILTSASDYHIYLKLKSDRKKAMESYLDIVKAALDIGIVPRCHLEDITRADFYGFVIPFVQELMELSASYKIPVKVRACDTMGYGVPYENTALPRSVPRLIHGLINDGGVQPHLLEWHGHNDFHKVLANAAAAWLYGCSAANGTILGFGERTGNPPIEALIFDYISIKGNTGIDTTIITDIAEYFTKKIGVVIPPNYPFVGSEFNVTRAGIHADGILKNEEIYNIFNTTKLLKRDIGIGVTDKSGSAGIAHWMNSYMGLQGKDLIDKNNPGVLRIKKWIDQEYENHRTTSISNEELIDLAKKYLPEYFKR
ncbi:MAG TPA: 2-isopropylmalate synthase [bacterium]|nr:2-isopropylmalate synthase [bacterium]